ncbi:MAG: hypothetical protein V1722_00365 [Candidatus Micrarchaeota archaeon]
MKSAQIELFMLTKMAMLFFIISLAFIALNISNMEKEALCGEQALSTAKIISSNINQALNAAVEDSRTVYKFEPTISTSRERYSRYVIWLAERETPGNDRVQLSVVVKPESEPNCMRRVSVVYDKNKIKTNFAQDTNPKSLDPTISPGEQVFVIEPTNRETPSKFLVIVKCRDKLLPQQSYLFFDDCKSSNPSSCSTLEPPAYDACK